MTTIRIPVTLRGMTAPVGSDCTGLSGALGDLFPGHDAPNPASPQTESA